MQHVEEAERKLLAYLNKYPGFLGLRINHPEPGQSIICVRWLENTAIPPLPAVVQNVRIVILPTALNSPIVSGWFDQWKDAWAEYKQTVYELATGRQQQR